MPRELDWQSTPAPDHVQQARMYQIAYIEIGSNREDPGDDPSEIFFDAATGVFYLREGRRWLSSIQTFPFGEVKNQ